MRYLVQLTDRSGFKKTLEWHDETLPPYLKIPEPASPLPGWPVDDGIPLRTTRERTFYLDCERDGVAYYREF